MNAQVAFATEIGQRRRALLAGAYRPIDTRRLSMADVTTLQADRSPEARALVARKLGEQLGELVAGGHAQLVEALLRLLVQDPQTLVRQALAESVATSPYVPMSLARALARDDIAVARPVLERSPVLDDNELTQVIRTCASDHAMAVAAREEVSETLLAALIETGDRQVVLRVLARDWLEPSPALLEQIVEHWQGDDAVIDQVARRVGLPFALVERLIGVVEARLRRDPGRGLAITREQATERIRASRVRAMAGSAIRDQVERAFRRRLRSRLVTDGVTPDDLVRFIRSGDLVSFEVGISVMAELELGPCRRLLYHDDPRHAAALCARAGVPAPHYLLLRADLDRAADAARSTAPAADQDARSRSLLESYEQLRCEPELVDQLCGL